MITLKFRYDEVGNPIPLTHDPEVDFVAALIAAMACPIEDL